MIQQSVMPFKIKRTEERITARSGLALYAEWMSAMDVEALVNQHLPKPGSGHGYEAISYVSPLSLTLYGGGDAIEDAREIREDYALREIIGLKRVPSSSAQEVTGSNGWGREEAPKGWRGSMRRS